MNEIDLITIAKLAFFMLGVFLYIFSGKIQGLIAGILGAIFIWLMFDQTIDLNEKIFSLSMATVVFLFVVSQCFKHIDENIK
jgi:hypothetical protein